MILNSPRTSPPRACAFLASGLFALGLARADAAQESLPPSPPAVAAALAIAPTHYWLGVACEPVPELLKAHLPIDGGLVVCRIAPNSPAADAQLAEFDVIWRINGQTVHSNDQLNDCILHSAGASMRVELVRRGTVSQLTLAAAIRPMQEQLQPIIVAIEGENDTEGWLRIRQSLSDADSATGVRRLVIMQPGILLSDDRSAGETSRVAQVVEVTTSVSEIDAAFSSSPQQRAEMLHKVLRMIDQRIEAEEAQASTDRAPRDSRDADAAPREPDGKSRLAGLRQFRQRIAEQWQAACARAAAAPDSTAGEPAADSPTAPSAAGEPPILLKSGAAFWPRR